jgi:imidazolonepropionase
MSLRGVCAMRIVTCDPARAGSDDALGILHDGAVLFDDHAIRWIGPRKDAPGEVPLVDMGERLITPGLVDAHTHAAWTGSRHTEYAMRMAGADYLAIAQAGGGIVSSHRAIRDATDAELDHTLTERLRRMAAQGVTTVEVKSGYGLTPELELKQLRAIARAASNPDLPHVVPTFLALHAIPEAARADRDAYVRESAALVEHVAALGLAKFVDAYVDAKAFSIAEARLVCDAAMRSGLGTRLHVGQFADVGGAHFAAEIGARSADHLEHLDAAGAAALAEAKTAAVLLPTASFTLGQAPPPVALFREANVMMVVASDANPGTAPTESLPLALALAVRLYGLTPSEALLGATRFAASTLTESREAPLLRGMLAPGAHADLVVWDLPHEFALLQPWGTSRAHLVLRDGRAIFGGPF